MLCLVQTQTKCLEPTLVLRIIIIFSLLEPSPLQGKGLPFFLPPFCRPILQKLIYIVHLLLCLLRCSYLWLGSYESYNTKYFLPNAISQFASQPVSAQIIDKLALHQLHFRQNVIRTTLPEYLLKQNVNLSITA